MRSLLYSLFCVVRRRARPPSGGGSSVLLAPITNPTRPAISQAIDGVIVGISSVDSQFRSVGTQIRASPGDSGARGSKNKEAPSKNQRDRIILDKEWSEIFDAYQELIWRTRELAGEARATILDFTTILLPRLEENTTPLSFVALEMRSYDHLLQEQITKASNVKNAFLKLHQRVDQFRGHFMPPPRQTKKSRAIFDALTQLLRELDGFADYSSAQSGVWSVLSVISQGSAQAVPPPYLLQSDPAGPSHQDTKLVTKIVAICHLPVAVRVDIQRIRGHMEERQDQPQALVASLRTTVATYEQLVEALLSYQVSVS